MKKIKIYLTMWLLLAFPVAAQTQDASESKNAKPSATETAADPNKAQDDSIRSLFESLKSSFELGGQFTNIDGERPSKFEATRRVKEGFLFRRFRISSNPEDSPWFFRLVGRNPSEKDQHYFLDMGKYERFRTTIEWNGSPYVYSNGSRSLFTASGPGVYTIPDAVQNSLQNTLDVNLPAAVQALLADAPLATLRVQRETLRINQKFNVTDKWSVRFRLLDEKRYGSRPLGNGSYERVGTPFGDTFRALAVELPEPVDYRSDQFTLGTSYVEKKWAINFDYTYSQFRNRIDTLLFDNPFRVTDAQANPPSGGVGRLRYARGLYDLAPNNSSHSFLISGFVDLPFNSRWASALGWSFWRQDDPFVPFTTNTAITAANLPAGVKPTDLAALPEPSLDGKIDTFTQDHLFTTRVTDSLRVNLHYRYYDYDNLTPVIEWPGYAAFNESFWRTFIVSLPTLPAPTPVPIENEPNSFLKQTATSEVVWTIAKPVTWKIEYEFEAWNRAHRQLGRSNEHSIGTTLSLKPIDHVSAKINYRYSDRLPGFYDSGLKEFFLLRMFDQARRIRHDADVQFQVRATPRLGISGTLGYWSDDYDQHYLGLVKYIQGYGSVEMLYNPIDTATIYANYSREQVRSNLQSVSKTAAPFNLNNRWDRQSGDVVDSFGVGVTAYTYGDRLALDCHYAFSLASNRVKTFNPFPVVPTDLLNAQASDWPRVESRFHELNLDASYQLNRNWGIGARYIYEPYRLDDYSWNGLAPYPIAQLPTENDGKRFLLLDSRYSSYDAHVFGVYLRFTFGGKEQ
ncbi:MAG: MtrB/PioB family decaheme-associated outer membrane protein [Acidobacteriota bacterium]